MRTIAEVIKAVQAEVPESEVRFHEKLAWLMQYFANVPDDVIQVSWEEFHNIMYTFIGPVPTKAWEIKAAAVYADKSVAFVTAAVNHLVRKRVVGDRPRITAPIDLVAKGGANG